MVAMTVAKPNFKPAIVYFSTKVAMDSLHRSAKSAHRLKAGAKEISHRFLVEDKQLVIEGIRRAPEHDRPDCSNQHLALLDVADDSLSCHFKSP